MESSSSPCAACTTRFKTDSASAQVVGSGTVGPLAITLASSPGTSLIVSVSTFSLASAAGTVATLRGYRLMPLVWATLMPLAIATGDLRSGGDKHYLSDVLTGAVLGAAVGVALPLLFHGRERDDRVPIGSGAVQPAASPLHAQTPMVSIGGGF